MTPHDPIKAAAEDLQGANETLKVLDTMAREAELRLGEAETRHNALVKARAMVADIVVNKRLHLMQLREEAEQKK